MRLEDEVWEGGSPVVDRGGGESKVEGERGALNKGWGKGAGDRSQARVGGVSYGNAAMVGGNTAGGILVQVKH